MKKTVSIFAIVFSAGLLAFSQGQGVAAEKARPNRLTETYVPVAMPPGFQVIVTDLDGPVFADARGKTLYSWPVRAMRNGYAGDPKGKSVCGDEVIHKSAGLMSPYPPGLDLPEPATRKSCMATWPPAYAPDDAKPVDKWTIITRANGKRQWAYDDFPLYTSIADRVPGDVLGGSTMTGRGDSPAARDPIGPPPAVPPGFRVDSTVVGRKLSTDGRYAIYQSDADGPNKSNCTDACARTWTPILAPASAQPQGEWSIVSRAPGVRQWAFRKKPLYTYTGDPSPGKTEGEDVPGWHLVYTQMVPPAPKDFVVQVTMNGDVLADAKGKTVYYYTCGEDSDDMMPCDRMESPQAYRFAVCGNFDVAKCLRTWPYVTVSAGTKSESHLWTAVWVDPKTGHAAEANQPGALNVWAYRGKPVYTYAGDREPGEFLGHNTGEWHGRWNGYQAFWIKDLGGRN